MPRSSRAAWGNLRATPQLTRRKGWAPCWNELIPHASNLRPAQSTWREAWRAWCDGKVLTQQSKQLIVGFQSTFALRQEDDLPEGDKQHDSSEMVSATLTEEERTASLQTTMKQKPDCCSFDEEEQAERAHEVASVH